MASPSLSPLEVAEALCEFIAANGGEVRGAELAPFYTADCRRKTTIKKFKTLTKFLKDKEVSKLLVAILGPSADLRITCGGVRNLFSRRHQHGGGGGGDGTSAKIADTIDRLRQKKAQEAERELTMLRAELERERKEKEKLKALLKEKLKAADKAAAELKEDQKQTAEMLAVMAKSTTGLAFSTQDVGIRVSLKPEPQASDFQGFLTRLVDPFQDRRISGTIVDFDDDNLHHQIEWDDPTFAKTRRYDIGQLWNKKFGRPIKGGDTRVYEFDWVRKALDRASAQWQCEVEGGKWANFEVSISDQLEAAHASKAAVAWTRDGFEYIVDWHFMVQINTSTRMHRTIRRKLIVSSKYKSGAALDHSEGWRALGTPLGGGTTCYTILAPTPGSKQEESKELKEFNFGHLRNLYSRSVSQCSSGYSELKPTKVEVYDSVAMYERWAAKKQEIGGSSRAIWVFHGTAAENIGSIMTDGFKVGGPGGNAPNGRAYGDGIYTADGPDTPLLSYGKGKCVILARAFEGVSSEGAGCGDSWRPKADWVVFKDGAQLLPQYAIYF